MSNFNAGALLLNPQNTITPALSGGTLGFSLGTAPTVLLNANTQVQKVTFHNPGTIDILVCQATDANGNALVPGANGGSWRIFPGGLLIFTGNGAGAGWLGVAASESGNPLTVAVSQTL